MESESLKKEVFNQQTGEVELMTLAELIEFEAERGNDKVAATYRWNEIK